MATEQFKKERMTSPEAGPYLGPGGEDGTFLKTSV